MYCYLTCASNINLLDLGEKNVWMLLFAQTVFGNTTFLRIILGMKLPAAWHNCSLCNIENCNEVSMSQYIDNIIANAFH